MVPRNSWVSHRLPDASVVHTHSESRIGLHHNTLVSWISRRFTVRTQFRQPLLDREMDILIPQVAVVAHFADPPALSFLMRSMVVYSHHFFFWNFIPHEYLPTSYLARVHTLQPSLVNPQSRRGHTGHR